MGYRSSKSSYSLSYIFLLSMYKKASTGGPPWGEWQEWNDCGRVARVLRRGLSGCDQQQVSCFGLMFIINILKKGTMTEYNGTMSRASSAPWSSAKTLRSRWGEYSGRPVLTFTPRSTGQFVENIPTVFCYGRSSKKWKPVSPFLNVTKVDIRVLYKTELLVSCSPFPHSKLDKTLIDFLVCFSTISQKYVFQIPNKLEFFLPWSQGKKVVFVTVQCSAGVPGNLVGHLYFLQTFERASKFQNINFLSIGILKPKNLLQCAKSQHQQRN